MDELKTLTKMKTRFIVLAWLIAVFSCTPNKSLTDDDKETIKGEIKEVVDVIIQGCEEANFDMAMEAFLDSPEMVFIFNGTSMDYQGVVDGMGPLFNELSNQEVTILDEKYVFLNKEAVIYTANCTFLEHYKDGHSVLSDPMVLQCTFIKVDDTWKVINGVESSVRQDVTEEAL